jgi:hypothetical protein
MTAARAASEMRNRPRHAMSLLIPCSSGQPRTADEAPGAASTHRIGILSASCSSRTLKRRAQLRRTLLPTRALVALARSPPGSRGSLLMFRCPSARCLSARLTSTAQSRGDSATRHGTGMHSQPNQSRNVEQRGRVAATATAASQHRKDRRAAAVPGAPEHLAAASRCESPTRLAGRTVELLELLQKPVLATGSGASTNINPKVRSIEGFGDWKDTG